MADDAAIVEDFEESRVQKDTKQVILGVNQESMKWQNQSRSFGTAPLFNSSKCHVKKTRADINTNQLDSRGSNLSASHDEGHYQDNNIIIGSKSKHGSGVLLLGSTRPLRCLSASCVSLKDLEPDTKIHHLTPRSRGRKKVNKKQNKANSDSSRLRYVQRLKQVISAGNNKQNQAETDREMGLKPQRYQLRTTELIWLELQSWLNDRSLADQDLILYNTRQCIVKDVLSLLNSFNFEKRHLERITLLRCQIDHVRNQLPDAPHDGDCPLTLDEQQSENEQAPFLVVKECGETGVAKRSLCLKDTSQKFCDLCLSVPSDLKNSLQHHAVKQVGELLRFLCFIENLYPSSAMLAREFSCYSRSPFQCKVNALCCWYNITLDLQQSFSSLIQILTQSLPNSGTKLLIGTATADFLEGSTSCDSNPNVEEMLASYAATTLRQKSVKSILQSLISRYFTALLRAKMALMPESYYESDLLLESELASEKGSEFFNGDSSGGSERLLSSDKFLYITIKPVIKELQDKQINALFQKMGNVLSLSDIKICKGRCISIVNEDTPALMSEKEGTVFGLPSVKPLYMFFSCLFSEIMKHCMQQRMKQAMPFFENCAPSVCLLTAKQLVMESKEMLECAFLARDITQFFVGDVCKLDINPLLICAYEGDLHCMISTYLEFVSTWLLRMQRDLPHVPRGFQETLEQEWMFVCNMSPHLDLSTLVHCYSRFVDITSDIIGSTEEFLVIATSELFCSQPTLLTSSYTDSRKYACYDQMKNAPNTDNREYPSKAQAGLLWFHRQRSESPHLSSSSSNLSSGSFAAAVSPEEFSTLSEDFPANNMPDLGSNFQLSRELGFRKRYLFELCRAVRDLFNETRERSMRILSFAKHLRKNLEPGIAYDFFKEKNAFSMCMYCTLMKSLHSSGYVIVDFEDSVISNPCGWQIDVESCTMLENFWVMILDPSLVKGASLEHYDARTEDYSSNDLWHVFQHSLLHHLTKVNHPAEDENLQLGPVIFVKKPFCHRLQDKANLNSERKYRQKNMSHSLSIREQRFEQSGKYMPSHFDSGANNCHFEHQCLGFDCTSKRIFGKHSFDNLKLICQSFDFTHDITVVVPLAENVGIMRKEFNILFSPFAKPAVGQLAVVRDIEVSFVALRSRVIKFCEAVMNCIECCLNWLEVQNEKTPPQQPLKNGPVDTDSKWQLRSEVNEVMQSCFNFAFDLVKEATRIMSGAFRNLASEKHVMLVKQWMDYALRHREKGNGRRPRWASQGLMFLCSLDTSFWMEMSDEKFEELKHKIDNFIQHLVGETQSGFGAKSFAERSLFEPPKLPTEGAQILRSLSNSSSSESAAPMSPHLAGESTASQGLSNGVEENLAPAERVRMEIEEMEEMIDRKRMEAGIIGRVSSIRKKNPIINLGIRTVNFKWQRGARIGEGAFGRVYTCVNIDTGRILAMKEVKFHPNDHQKIRSAVDEYTNFEGIKHQNLVQYYGVELHRDEMYIFMEYCDGGTLGEICKVNLPDPMVRKYTGHLLNAIYALHARGIVHRDIKGSNIFLDSITGMVKLGDFGSAIKLKDVSKTAPGEMISQIGTTLPYSAPEVINSSEKFGYGRASDIWSLGCVVIEMASGKQPWHDLERFQVMFQIGSGQSPPVPETFSKEGVNFVRLCTATDPSNRWTAEQLLGHTFVKVLEYDDFY